VKVLYQLFLSYEGFKNYYRDILQPNKRSNKVIKIEFEVKLIISSNTTTSAFDWFITLASLPDIIKK